MHTRAVDLGEKPIFVLPLASVPLQCNVLARVCLDLERVNTILCTRVCVCVCVPESFNGKTRLNSELGPGGDVLLLYLEIEIQPAENSGESARTNVNYRVTLSR